MAKVVKYCIAFLLTCALLICFWSCFTINTPPSEKYAKMCLARDHQEILLIKDYLMDSEYTSVYLREDFKTGFADFKQISISDSAVVAALQRLKSQGYEDINKFGNTVEFRVWVGQRDISCGIAYVVPGSKLEIQYVTEVQPLSENGWYYYIADYEEWRIDH